MYTQIIQKKVANFGRNHIFRPQSLYQPASENELLEIMRRHKGQRFRAASRLHSWGEGVICEDVMIDLRRMNDVRLVEAREGLRADVQAGCQVKRLLVELIRLGNWTLPSVGLITQQAIGGATATGTHGSGKNSLSHYLAAVRIANFDPQTGEPRVIEIDSSPELECVRCSLGCLGIVTGVTIAVREQYRVEEHFARYASVEDVLSAESDYPIQQFFLIPWRWDFFAQHRRETDRPRSLLATVYRVYFSLVFDIAMHLIVISLALWFPRWVTAVFFKKILPLFVVRGWRVVDRSDKQLTMGHHYFRHLETEIFVPRSKLPAALELFKWLLRHFGGEKIGCPDAVRSQLEATGDWDNIDQHCGAYVAHYPICCRKVAPDATTISMASGGDEAWYAVSFITYQFPNRRAGFFQLMDIMVRVAAKSFGARPHWGKHCPIDAATVDAIYPKINEFRHIVAEFDANGDFTNSWTRRVLLRA
jgi:FAD/FMN-containing dehydrogenase